MYEWTIVVVVSVFLFKANYIMLIVVVKFERL